MPKLLFRVSGRPKQHPRDLLVYDEAQFRAAAPECAALTNVKMMSSRCFDTVSDFSARSRQTGLMAGSLIDSFVPVAAEYRDDDRGSLWACRKCVSQSRPATDDPITPPPKFWPQWLTVKHQQYRIEGIRKRLTQLMHESRLVVPNEPPAAVAALLLLGDERI
jgi:hypothetical protein